MSKARTLADFISDGSEFADGTISVAEVSGAAPLASPSFTGTLYIPQWIEHSGDSNTYFGFPGGDEFKIVAAAVGRLHMTGSQTVFTEGGEDRDFRVESTGQSHMLFVDAANDKVGIATVPSSRLHIKDTNTSTGSTNPPHLRIEGNNGLFYDIGRDNAGTGYLSFYGNQTNANGYIFGGVNGERMQINADGAMIHQRGAVFNESGIDRDFRVESNNNANMLFVDAANDVVFIGASSDPSNQSIQKLSVTAPFVEAGSSQYNSTLSLVATGGSQTSGRGASIRFTGEDGTSARTLGGIDVFKDNGISGNHDGTMVLRTRKNASGMPSRLRLDPQEAVFNDDSDDTDFRVESDANSNMLHINAGDSHVNIGSSTAHGVLGVQQGASAGVNATTLGLNHVHANNKYIDFKWYNNSIMNIAQEGGSNIGINWNNTLAFNSSESGSSDFRIASDTISHLFAIDASENRVSIGGTNFGEGSGYIFNVRGGTSRFANPAADATVRIEGGAYTDPHRARLTLTGGYGDTGRTRFWHIDGQAHGGGGNVYNDLRFSYEVTNSATLYEVLRFNNDGQVIVNEDGRGNVDLRVESDTQSHMLFVDAGGNGVGINRSTVYDTFHVQAVSSTDSACRFEPNTIDPNASSSDPTVIVLSQKAPTLDLNRYYSHGTIVQFRHNNDAVGSIYVNGSSTTYYTSSDYRLKENVVELTGATDRLKQLQPKRFNFIADADTTVDGFLAHEVQSIVPEAIGGTKDEVDADGNPVYQGIDQAKLVPLLVATIKELEARITALESA